MAGGQAHGMGVIGVDEAGRGPVLGSMFVAAVHVDDPAALPAGVDDSKRLQPATRRDLADALEGAGHVTSALREVPVARIETPDATMTDLVAEASAAAIGALQRPAARVIVDTGERDTGRYATRVTRHLGGDRPIDARVGADGDVPAVGAASILAKEARERHVAMLRERYGAVGSGYPSDPATRAFLAGYVDRHDELPACARRNWATCRDVLAAARQADLDAFGRVEGRPE